MLSRISTSCPAKYLFKNCAIIIINIFCDVAKLALYVVCFDLSASVNEQRRQISTWLHYLNSLLQLKETPSSSILPTSIILVGTKADKMAEKQVIINNTEVYQQSFPSLHFLDKVHYISTLYDPTSARNLIVDIENQCANIMNEHAKDIPRSYRQLLKDITSMQFSNPLIPISSIQSLPNTKWSDDLELMKRGLAHLHSIGEIVMFGDEMICTKPQDVSRLLAKFISPAEVRNALLFSEEEQVSILSHESISNILRVHSNRYLYKPNKTQINY